MRQVDRLWMIKNEIVIFLSFVRILSPTQRTNEHRTNEQGNLYYVPIRCLVDFWKKAKMSASIN